MNYLKLFLLIILISSCAKKNQEVVRSENILTYEQAVELQKRQVLENNPIIAEYFKERLEYENNISLYESKKCYAIPGEGVTLLMRINKAGVIDMVLAEEENPKTECYRKTYLGTKFKEPKIYPLFARAQMDYKHN